MANKENVPSRGVLSPTGRFAYALGAAAYGIKENGLLYFLPLFYIIVMGLPPHWVGGVLAFALVVDAISDPLIGYLSDRWRSTWLHWGRRHPLMYMAILPLSVSYAFLWNPPAFSPTGLLLWLVCFVILIRVLATVYDIPQSALAPELTSDYDERTKLMSYRLVAAWFGGLTIAFLNWHWFLVPSFFSPEREFYDPEGYAIMGITAGCLIFVVALTSAVMTHKYIPQLLSPSQDHKPLKEKLRDVWAIVSNRSLVSLYTGSALISIGFGIKATMAVFLFLYFWQIPSTSIKFIIYVDLIATTFAIFLPVQAGLRWGKKSAAIIIGLATLVIVPLSVVMRLMGLLPDNASSWILPVLLVFELFSIVLIISSRGLLSALATDLVEETQRYTKERFEGFIFSINTFVLKAATGLGTFVGSLILAFSGFNRSIMPGDSSAEVMVVLNSTGFYYVFAFIIFYLLGLGCLLLYSIDKKTHEKTLALLSQQAA